MPVLHDWKLLKEPFQPQNTCDVYQARCLEWLKRLKLLKESEISTFANIVNTTKYAKIKILDRFPMKIELLPLPELYKVGFTSFSY